MAAPTPAQLAAEITADPVPLGYAARVATGNDAGVAALLNAPTATTVFRNDIAAKEVVNAILAADFTALTAVQVAKLQLMFTGGVALDATNANTQTIFLGIFSGMATTTAALTALAKRPGSRAEVLWGTGTVITTTQVSFALRGGN